MCYLLDPHQKCMCIITLWWYTIISGFIKFHPLAIVNGFQTDAHMDVLINIPRWYCSGGVGGEWMVKNMRNLVSLWYTVHVITTTYTSPPSVLSRDCCIVTSPCRCTPARAAHTSCNSSDPSQGMWRPSPEYVLLSSRRTSGDECLVSADTRSGILPQCRMLLLTIENDEKHLDS